MRIRTIKPEFFLHEGLHELEQETGLPIRLAFIGLWCAADREGRFKWEPRRLGVSILPYDDIDFSRVLDALTTRGFLVHYASESREFGCIPSFHRHQVINNRERPSDLPEYLKGFEIQHFDASSTREARVDHASKAEGKGRERNKEQGVSADFEAFWQAYPRKVGKGAAQKAWDKLKPDLDSVLAALAWQTKQDAWTKDGGQFIPHPGTYLNQRRWEDEKPLDNSNATRYNL